MANQPTMRDVCAIGRDGRRVDWPLPAKWKKQSVTPRFASVASDRYTACASEIVDLETTGPIFGMHLRPPAALEMRIDDKGWTPHAVRAPLAYVPPGFAFSSRWSSDIEWITVHFDAAWLARAGLQAGGHTIPSLPHLDLNDDLLMQIVRSIHEDAVAGAPLGPTYVETLGAAALGRMAYLESTRQAREYTHARAMQAAVEYIRDNFREPLTLVALAEAVGYPGDLYAFIRSFKKAHRLTPHQYIIETRLQAARDLIERGRSDVTEAALACGFSTTSHFSATFRKRWGFSPSGLKPRAASVMRAAATGSTDR
ncbi:AraC family transcriptional regulator [Burkholderia pseudomultivorans]|uniref:AraC family transcriptional regulator n=1 Tax=Burkholderia pseudomultivorans TaxID=1207504 RepID=UPI000841521C|nr:AraC family transcriptional regulator [Burkholderia pseudomultivorans]AOI91470.1 AraC family transcriptional regulator [Burkholderia pseudomultivorans]